MGQKHLTTHRLDPLLIRGRNALLRACDSARNTKCSDITPRSNHTQRPRCLRQINRIKRPAQNENMCSPNST
jgi:hypothetical protein